MPAERPSRRPDRSQLPAELTPATVRAMDMRTARLLARPGNGVLTPDEQRAFDAALREVMQTSADRLGRSAERWRPGGPPDLDPDLRRSYQRTQRRLEAQAARARRAFPQLAAGWELDPPEPATVDTGLDPGPDPAPQPEAATESESEAEAESDDVTIGTFEAEIAQTSDMMEVLEQIAGIQQQQLDHQRSQVLSETRGIFFAPAVSVAVIVAGVAPLVEASPHERRLILLWTAAVCAAAGGVYAIVRAVQSDPD